MKSTKSEDFYNVHCKDSQVATGDYRLVLTTGDKFTGCYIHLFEMFKSELFQIQFKLVTATGTSQNLPK